MAEDETAPEIRFIEGEFQRVSLGPDDVVVLMHPERISRDMIIRLGRHMEVMFPGRKCVVLEEGMKIGAMGPDNGD